MASKAQIVQIRGKLNWAKVLPKQLHDNYNKDGKEWTFDLQLDKDGVKHAKQHKELNIREPNDSIPEPFLKFKQKYEYEDRNTGEIKYRDPIKIVDAAGNKWDDNTEIGNGTVADVKFEIRDFGKGRYPGIYPRAIRILEHVPYERNDFEALDESDPYYEKAVSSTASDDEFRKDFGLAELDDEVEDIL